MKQLGKQQYNNGVCNMYESNVYVLGKGIMFDRVRRITGYLTGNLNTWNNAKKDEEKDRVKHSCNSN